VIDIIKSIKEFITFLYHSSRSYNKEHPIEDEQNVLNNQILTGNLNHDIQEFKMIFERSSDIVYREFQVGCQ